ncbi:hypothetical protein HSR121_1105 [Halapricum desulfuricans]|uniref:Uncharacterized protein n=1 Tax=Halapricum desulfuricans TaxID=2841257 RepID=A0A897MXU4_9EURY|nr:hypothetical protein HSR121_1105 [Halapricum desulfuricans]
MSEPAFGREPLLHTRITVDTEGAYGNSILVITVRLFRVDRTK